jgi:hypothetical protein
MTVRIDRLEAIRMLGEHMRKKTQEFEREKRGHTVALEKVRTVAIKCVEKRMKELLQATKIEQLSHLLAHEMLEYKERNKLPSTPELNLCREKQLLLMLQNDVRKIIPNRVYP